MNTTTPASGKVRWLPDDPVTGNPWLRIATGRVVQDYEVEHVYGTKYRLWKLDPQTFSLTCYNVTLNKYQPECDCPDSQHRRLGACKHVRALRAALGALPF